MSKDKNEVLDEEDIQIDSTPKIKFHKEGATKKGFKHYWDRISYAIVPFLCVIAAILVSWLGNQLFGKPTGFQPNLPIDASMPYIPQFVIFYFLCFPVCIVAYFVLAYRNRARLYDITALIVISYIISGLIYYFAQTEFPLDWKYSWLPETLSFWDKFVVATWHSSLPTNLMPSQHCYMAIACMLTLIGFKKTHWAYTTFMIVFNIGVILSTWFIKQHFVMDLIASFAIMSIVYLILRLCKFGDRLDARLTYNKQIKMNKKNTSK